MKTKTDLVDHVLGVPDKGNAVIGSSLNAERESRREDGTHASVESRLAAAGRSAESGYLLAFHFDRIFLSADWEERYSETVARLGKLPSERIAWIGMNHGRID